LSKIDENEVQHVDSVNSVNENAEQITDIPIPETGWMVDPRDGKKYKTIYIAGLWWMAENLNFEAPNDNSRCYNNDENNCKKYGSLYGWNYASNACPEGWKLPEIHEYSQLLDYYPYEYSNQGNQLLEGGVSGFNAQRSGYGSSELEDFYDLSVTGYYWTGTEDGWDKVFYLEVSQEKNEILDTQMALTNGYLYSVRCVKE